MIWRWPGTIPPGRKIASPVSLLDVPATLAAHLGLADMDVLQGRTLWPGLTGGELPADRLIVVEKANGDQQHVVAQQGSWRLHRFWTAGKEAPARCELYDLSADAGESKDLYKGGGGRKLEQPLDESLRATKVIHDAFHSRSPNGAVGMSEADRRRLQELGYINK